MYNLVSSGVVILHTHPKGHERNLMQNGMFESSIVCSDEIIRVVFDGMTVDSFYK